MDTAKRIAELTTYAEDQVDIVNGHLHTAFTQLCREVVADWRRRYPRHRFRVWEAHGMISTDISPPLGRDKRREWKELDYCGIEPRRAVKTLMDEAKALHDAFNSLDLKVQFSVSQVESTRTGARSSPPPSPPSP